MMTCKYGSISDYAGCTYEELLDLRGKVMADIISFEEEKELEENWYKKPGADYEYRLNLEFLSSLINAIDRRFQLEHTELLKSISSGEFKANGNEGRVSQLKRCTRLRNEAFISNDNTDFVEFAVNDNGKVDAFIAGKHAGTVIDIFATSEYEFSNVLESSGSYLLLEAECHYRKFIGAGSLRKTIWEIYSDGSYTIRHVYNLNWDEMERADTEAANAGKEKVISGIMDEEHFQKLQDAISKDLWRNASVRRNARDESEWMIYMYDAKGNTVKDSGALGNIRGNRNIEDIVSRLPSSEE